MAPRGRNALQPRSLLGLEGRSLVAIDDVGRRNIPDPIDLISTFADQRLAIMCQVAGFHYLPDLVHVQVKDVIPLFDNAAPHKAIAQGQKSSRGKGHSQGYKGS